MKWIVILLIAAAGVWAYFNVDFTNLGSNTNQTIREEKTMKKFFKSDDANRQETKKVLEEY